MAERQTVDRNFNDVVDASQSGLRNAASLITDNQGRPSVELVRVKRFGGSRLFQTDQAIFLMSKIFNQGEQRTARINFDLSRTIPSNFFDDSPGTHAKNFCDSTAPANANDPR